MLLPMSSDPQPTMKVCCLFSNLFLSYMYSLQDPLYQYLFFYKSHCGHSVQYMCKPS